MAKDYEVIGMIDKCERERNVRGIYKLIELKLYTVSKQQFNIVVLSRRGKAVRFTVPGSSSEAWTFSKSVYCN